MMARGAVALRTRGQGHPPGILSPSARKRVSQSLHADNEGADASGAPMMPMGDESMLQALEHTADQIDRLAEIIDEFLTMGEAGVPMSATRRQKYAAEMAELRGHREQLRETIAAFWVLIGRNNAQ